MTTGFRRVDAREQSAGVEMKGRVKSLVFAEVELGGKVWKGL